MRRIRRGRSFLCAMAVAASALVPAATGAPPAAATHTLSFLQVTPEIATVGVNATVTLTARLFLFPALLGRTAVPASIEGVVVHFDLEGGPLGTQPNKSCTVVSLETTCTITLQSTSAGSTLVRAWIDGETTIDNEGRLANVLAEENAAADCIGSGDGDADAAACRSGDVANPGAVVEPDGTDVVRVTWLNRGLDVQPDVQTRALGDIATLTATAYDLAGNPAPDTLVKWEFFEGSVSDLGGGTTVSTPDRTCTTGAAGSCAVTFAQAANGVDVLCAWTSSVPPTASGKATDNTAICDGESVSDASANDGKPSPADDDQDVVRVTWGSGPPVTPGTNTSASATGYWLVASDGGIFAFGDATFRGSTGAIRLNQPMVGMAATPSRNGYWLVASDGGIFAFGDATFRGSTGAIKLNQSMVGMASTPSGNGYWLVAKDGGIFAFGDAVFRGSTGGIKLNQPIVGMAPTPSGNGYWLVAADGGIFAFGDAVFHGSTGAIRLNQQIVGMSRGASGAGYRLVARDGGIFAFGDAAFRGSTGAIKLNQPMVGMSGF